jgi:hypothetical protein
MIRYGFGVDHCNVPFNDKKKVELSVATMTIGNTNAGIIKIIASFLFLL